MISTLQVLIVEDDFRVAEINRQLIEQIAGFHVVTEAKTAVETLEILRLATSLPDIILLDIYIPDSPGLKLFWQLRKEYPSIDIILLTATKDSETIEEVLHGGVSDFLIKPVDHDRFTKAFTQYRAKKVLLASKSELTQADLDRIFNIQLNLEPSLLADGLPKGIDKLTLMRIERIVEQSSARGMTAIDVGDAAGVSRSTARRYLEYLVSIVKLEAQLQYGDVGRPERTYIKL